MAVVPICDFESTGPPGTTLSSGNTGGTMGMGTGAVAVSTNTGVGAGALAGSYSVTATAASARTDFNVAGAATTFAYSIKFHVPTAFATTKQTVRLVNTSAATLLTINLNGSTGQVNVQDAASVTTSMAASTFTTGVTYRLELLVIVGTTTTGFFNLNIYNNDNTTPLTAAATKSNANLGIVGLSQIQAGIINNGTTVAANIIIDSIRLDAGGTVEIGPEVAIGSVTGNVANTGTVDGSVSASGSVSGSTTAGGTVSGVVGLFGSVTGSVSAGGSVSGSVGKRGSVTGATTATGTVSGLLGKLGAVSGTVTAGGLVTGAIARTGAVTGSVLAGGSVVARVNILSSVTGAATCSGSVIGLVLTGSEPTTAFVTAGVGRGPYVSVGSERKPYVTGV